MKIKKFKGGRRGFKHRTLDEFDRHAPAIKTHSSRITPWFGVRPRGRHQNNFSMTIPQGHGQS
ncbi:MAG: hypothetical protein MUO88_11190 [Desulfobacterales bacterium]|nr:hypothetical protein [Desulfobacterales bacterium]